MPPLAEPVYWPAIILLNTNEFKTPLKIWLMKCRCQTVSGSHSGKKAPSGKPRCVSGRWFPPRRRCPSERPRSCEWCCWWWGKVCCSHSGSSWHPTNQQISKDYTLPFKNMGSVKCILLLSKDTFNWLKVTNVYNVMKFMFKINYACHKILSSTAVFNKYFLRRKSAY